MSPRLTRAQAQAQTRERLLQAAAQVFALRGFAGATLENIAEQAEFSRGAVYAHFANKEELFLALIDLCLAEQEQALRAIFQQDVPFRDQIMEASRWSPHLLEHPRDWLILTTEFWLHALRHPHVQEKLAIRYQQQRQTIAALVVQTSEQQARTLLAPAEQLAEAIVALLNGLAMRALIVPEQLPETLPATMLAVLLNSSNHQ